MERPGGASIVLSQIRCVAETGSTNVDLLALAASGAPEASWLRAERQTAGRGRQGRAWESPVGNLYASTLVRLRPTDPPAATLSLVAGVALAEVVLSYVGAGCGVALKWPNDLLVGRAKLAGILLERADNAVVAGIGVNLAHHPDLADRATTSLAVHGAVVAPADFIETLADSFGHWLRRWRGEGLGPVRDRWTAHAHRVGTALQVRLPDGGVVDGLFEGLSSDGALMLRLADGRLHVMHAGDVFLV
ncbi:biotin--[acetyl-CoA-carboxylase] ligase [Sphingomonas sp. 37zxx]|uniref:biotin--[acetyl-CoA-carboxylase] ligase n=1 Tax=Sphingomonas sp. 37zxx TaxID=1550073 RepID=UPI001E5FCAB8|nr:biotin--[acetyl-CoA-carboxylase] ligase [Sphingomonas sp. 37zxx]